MKFSLWANNTVFVQSSHDKAKLLCNGNQFRTWWAALGCDETPKALSIRDNTLDCETHAAVYVQGTVLRWRETNNSKTATLPLVE
jgi:hypothetical protein